MTYGRGYITIERGKHRVRVPDGKGGTIEGGSHATLEAAELMRDALLLGRAEVGGVLGLSVRDYGERVIERWVRAGMRDAGPTRSRWAIVARAPFADLPLSELARADVRDWARSLPQQRATRSTPAGRVELARALSWQSCRHALGLLGRVLAEAVDDGLRTDNPARGVRLPRRQDRAESWTWLTAVELERVQALPLTAEQHAAIALAVYQGLRQGELAALTWERVDLEAAWLVVAASWGTATKSGRVRRIPLLPAARAALERWRPDPAARSGLVLPAPGGGLRSRGYDWGWGDRRNGPDVPTRAGITRRVRFHDLRHTCASHLVSGSWGPVWTLRQVRDFLGHTAEAVTERYAHLAPDSTHARAQQTGQPAANPPQSVAVAAAQVLDFIGRAMGDSNARPLAPESEVSRAIPGISLEMRRVGGDSAALAVLEAAAAGVELPGWAVVELARAALGSGGSAALRALAGGPSAARAAVDLAEAVLEAAAPALPTTATA
jgi:integrase